MKENYSTGQSFNYNVYASINPLKGLNLRVEYAGNASTGESHYFQPAYQYGYVIQDSQSTIGNSASKYRSFKTYATYDFSQDSLGSTCDTSIIQEVTLGILWLCKQTIG